MPPKPLLFNASRCTSATVQRGLVVLASPRWSITSSPFKIPKPRCPNSPGLLPLVICRPLSWASSSIAKNVRRSSRHYFRVAKGLYPSLLSAEAKMNCSRRFPRSRIRSRRRLRSCDGRTSTFAVAALPQFWSNRHSLALVCSCAVAID